MNGWIKVDRDLMEDDLFNERREYSKFEAWVDILRMANYQDGYCVFGMEKIEYKRGQCLISIPNWAKRWHWSESKVKRFFTLLRECGKIRTEDVRKTTRLTICEYDSYEDSRTEDEPQTGLSADCERPTDKEDKEFKKKEIINNPLTPKGETGEDENNLPEDQQAEEQTIIDTLEEEKKKKTPLVPPPPPIEYPYGEPFLEVWCEWEAFRAENRWVKYKPIGLKSALREIVELAGDNENKAIAIIRRSMAKSWKGFFPLPEAEQRQFQSQTKSGYSTETTIQAGMAVADKLTYIDEQRRLYPERYYKHAVKGWQLKPEYIGIDDNAA